MIRIEHLTKRFDTVDAVKDVSLEIPEGIMYGLLGTNGAGKSTLLRLIAGILQADEGRIEIEGDSCYDNPKCKSCFFYLPDTPYYFPNGSIFCFFIIFPFLQSVSVDIGFLLCVYWG